MSNAGYPNGTTVNDRYVLREKLGSDGAVYRAYDRHLDTDVALKLLDPVAGAPQPWDEAARLEQLRSRFIVPVINADVVVNSDVRFITTPLVPDGDLEADARPHGFSVAVAVGFGRQVAAGIDTIHRAGMIHRDVKPANALRDGDTVLVSDVAMCCLLGPDGTADRNGSFCTLAPEAAPEPGRCSIASDIYSIAATVFYLLSGEYPVDHRLPKHAQRDLLAAGDLRDIGDLAPHVPRGVAAVIRRGLSVDPSGRHRTADDFGNSLVTAMHGRRDWTRVQHAGHVYCAEGAAVGSRGPVGVCSEAVDPKHVRVRAFHLNSQRGIAGVSDKIVRASGVPAGLRSTFAGLN